MSPSLSAGTGNERTRFTVGDGQRLPFHNGAFDRTLSLLAINFVADPQTAAAEMTRVTRRGGIVAAAVWDYGHGMEMLRLFWDTVVALRPNDAPKDERHMRLCRSGELAALWRSRDLQDVTEDALTITTDFGSFDDYWNPFLEKQGPAGHYVAALSESDRDALRRALRHRLIGDGPDHAFTLTLGHGPLVVSSRDTSGREFLDVRPDTKQVPAPELWRYRPRCSRAAPAQS
jgi:SAM-dependent methyltransferase